MCSRLHVAQTMCGVDCVWHDKDMNGPALTWTGMESTDKGNSERAHCKDVRGSTRDPPGKDIRALTQMSGM